jgi:plasmid recombination enzyme
MMNIQEKGELDEWCSDSIQWLQATFGKDNVVAAHLHMDEKTPHIHAAVVPIVTGERRKAKKEQTDGKRKYRKKTNSVRLCADDLFNRQTLVAYHDNYARVMAKYGLQRGVRGSEARHTTTMQYYRDLKKKNEVLETETRLLQEKKTEAQEELRQVKAEIRTDKLKCAATDTATALASSVGSLFGSGKMKSLERRNEDLRDEIAIRDETIKQLQINIKQLQVEHSRAMMNKDNEHRKALEAKEAEHKKETNILNSIINTAHRWYPDFSNLLRLEHHAKQIGLSTIEFAELIKGKVLNFTGRLFSSEHNRWFTMENTPIQILRDNDRRLTLTVNRTPISQWFNEQYAKFRQFIRQPIQPKRNKELKL